MSSAVKQLVDSMPSSETGACKFLKILARRLDAVKDWLNLCDSNQEIELLVCLESIYADGKTKAPTSSLQQHKFRNLEDLTSSARMKPRLRQLAEGKTRHQIELKRNILKQLKDLSSVDTTEATTQIDWRDEMAALYEAFSKHKQCHDSKTDTTEALVTQMCLSEISQNNEMGLKISLLVLMHIHNKPYDAGLIRSWRHVEIDVFHQRIISEVQSQTTPRIQMTPIATPNANARQMKKTREFCKKISDGIQTQLLRLEVRNEKLYFVETLPKRTTWVLNMPSITLTSIIEHKCVKESAEMRLLICTAVAKAVWQFYGSGWWEPDCTIDNFRFVWASSESDSPPDLCINKPFFYNTMDEFDDDDANPSCAHSHPMILALGIILLEVELGIRIKNERNESELDMNGVVSPDTDLFVASRLCRDNTRWSERGNMRSIIENCVTGNTFKSSNDPEETRHTLFRDVVEPLENLLARKIGNKGVEGYCIPDACKTFGSFIVAEDSKNKSSETPLATMEENIINPPLNCEGHTILDEPSTHTSADTPNAPSTPSNKTEPRDKEIKDMDSSPTEALNGSMHPESEQAEYDGTFYSAPSSDASWIEPKLFVMLRQTWDKRLEYMKGDKPIKIAILDTGIDMQGKKSDSPMHDDFRKARAVSFQNGKPCSDPKGTPQCDRIKGMQNFCSGDEADVQDLDGHGTAVAGIILRLAPETELFIARICVGDVNHGVSEDKLRPVDENQVINPRPAIIKKAIEWAIKQEVNIINMSFGFTTDHEELKEALDQACQKNILVFAAMSNGSYYESAAWPASELKLCIGIHSCTPGGHMSSDFTPQPVNLNPNLIVVGEKILVHWLTSKGGGFRFAQGTSFATPVAVAMGALILTFVRQKRCASNRKLVPPDVNLDNLGKPWGMASVLTKISYTIKSEYSSVKPEILWVGYKGESGQPSRKHAWNIIEEALSPERIFEDKLKRSEQGR